MIGEEQARPKQILFAQFARVGKALASPARLELLDLLAQGERGVEDLADSAALKLTTASAHLQELRRAHLVETRREGTRIYYRLAGDDVERLVVAVRDVAAARLAEVAPATAAYLGEEVEPMGREELLRRAGAGEIVVVDVRPHIEYQAGHIPGAMSIPLDELEARLADLPDDLEVVAYCRGPYCALAYEAVRRLRQRGRSARRLVDGFPEWRRAGLPTLSGPRPGSPRSSTPIRSSHHRAERTRGEEQA